MRARFFSANTNSSTTPNLKRAQLLWGAGTLAFQIGLWQFIETLSRPSYPTVTTIEEQTLRHSLR